jgi:hypothetical protein
MGETEYVSNLYRIPVYIFIAVINLFKNLQYKRFRSHVSTPSVWFYEGATGSCCSFAVPGIG